MTKKDYEKAAAIVRRMRQNVLDSGCSVEQGLNEFRAIKGAQEAFAIFFAEDSARFNRDRFNAACKE